MIDRFLATKVESPTGEFRDWEMVTAFAGRIAEHLQKATPLGFHDGFYPCLQAFITSSIVAFNCEVIFCSALVVVETDTVSMFSNPLRQKSFALMTRTMISVG
ncbi:MAG: hypothetical protein JXR76_14890 [Deltaproteobacteria bacterium]|nr:hypothetical protein [Deltaproteobacteria bacterium]